MRTFSLSLIAVYLMALLITVADVDDGARPRYLTPLLIPVALLTAAGFAPASSALAARFGRRVRAIVVWIAVVFTLLQVAAVVYDRVPRLWMREGLYRVVDAAGLADAIVIVRAEHPSRFARNGPFFDRRVLYLSVPADVPARTVAAAYPGRATWEAHEGVPWTLTPVK
jgi:MFS family permease